MDDAEAKPEDPKPAEDDAKMNGGGDGGGDDAAAAGDNNGDSHGDGGEGNLHVRPVFFGNLSHACQAGDVEAMFANPPTGGEGGEPPAPIPVDRVDMKRGYCFVFLKDAANQAEKERAERFVQDICGMQVPNVSSAVRAEFARGDGRIKRKEDERRRQIQPNETLFVVNFHEETTKREDLDMLFSPYGKIVRIEMKRNYAFVQFETIDQAIAAKDATNGGKLDQSELTVEYVARRMGESRGPPRRRYDDDRRGGYRGGGGGGYRGGRDDYNYRGGGGRRDEYRPRGGGGGRDRYDDRDDRRGGYDRRRRSRSRSRSPGYRRRSRSRSPGYDRDRRRDEYRGRESYDDRDRGGDRGGGDRGYDRGDRGY